MSDDLIDRARAALKHAKRLGVPSPLLSDMADEIARLRAEVERLREELSLIAVMGHSDDPKVASRIAHHAVKRAYAAITPEASHD